MARPSVAHLEIERRDFTAIRETARRAVVNELGGIADPKERLRRAAEIVGQADVQIAAVVHERNACALSLAFYDGVRGIYQAMGTAKNGFDEMRRLALGLDKKTGKLPQGEAAATAAQAAEVRRIPDAGQQLPDLSEQVAVAEARRKAAVPFRQDACLVISEEPYGWTSAQIAELAGVTSNRVRDDLTIARKRRS
ncbi:hypothetical protein G3I60_05095 [Streptomyces sp. SID13666]|uniref:hypothetical protein n=1 Tax=Streptomyces sp. SID13666 TaxID=2706054 RepID=UPI0013C11A55|nr:hypothetical protein [Streptomyces sp. SID13666]NEA53546.1 hypothetical protein [Streptomyces sp. SID13666]